MTFLIDDPIISPLLIMMSTQLIFLTPLSFFKTSDSMISSCFSSLPSSNPGTSMNITLSRVYLNITRWKDIADVQEPNPSPTFTLVFRISNSFFKPGLPMLINNDDLPFCVFPKSSIFGMASNSSCFRPHRLSDNTSFS